MESGWWVARSGVVAKELGAETLYHRSMATRRLSVRCLGCPTGSSGPLVSPPGRFPLLAFFFSVLSPPKGQTVWACKICKVRLCKAKCFHRWDHDTNCAPCNRVLSL